MRSLWARLVLAFTLVVAVSVGLVAYLAHQSTTDEFTSYVEVGGYQYYQSATERLVAYYARSHGWGGVEAVLMGIQRNPNERLVLADANGVIVADTAGQAVGQTASALSAERQFIVVSAGRQVGTLYFGWTGPGRGRMGLGRGRGPGGGMAPASTPVPSTPPPAVSPGEPLEERFLTAVDRSLWLTALGALALAVVLSVVLARQITGSLAALQRGAHRIAAGDLTHRVSTTSKDEVGDLAHSFNAMAEALERNERARRNMVADVAHELKTPLTVIEGTATALLDGVFEPTPDNITTIRDQAVLLSKLVDDLRELSVAEAGQLQLDRVPTDVEMLVEQARRSAEAAVQAHGLTLHTQIEPGTPQVLVDPARIGQVLINLLSNAVRHTPPGGKVGIEAREDGQNVAFVVSDTGEGIPVEDLQFVFDRFYRTDRSRARRSGGTGLGLAIVKQLVEAHGGQVWADSTPGHGSRFHVVLPKATQATPH